MGWNLKVPLTFSAPPTLISCFSDSGVLVLPSNSVTDCRTWGEPPPGPPEPRTGPVCSITVGKPRSCWPRCAPSHPGLGTCAALHHPPERWRSKLGSHDGIFPWTVDHSLLECSLPPAHSFCSILQFPPRFPCSLASARSGAHRAPAVPIHPGQGCAPKH